MKVGSLLAELQLDKKGFDRALQESGMALGKFKGATALAAAAVVTGLAVGLGSAVGSAAGFESAMVKSTAIMGDLSDTMRTDLETAAREVAKVTTFSAQEAADSYFFLASAGLDAQASIKALPVVAQFAQAGMFDMALATDLLTDAQSALGLTIRDDANANMAEMIRLSDILVRANVLANATVQQFSESLTNKAGAALKTLNKDAEEGVAVLAAFADQGVKGELAGNALSIVLRDLQTANLKNRDAWEGHGLSVFDASGKMHNMADIVGGLEDRLGGMSDEQKKATLAQLGFADRSQAFLLTLLGTSDAIRGYEAALRDAGGYTEDVASRQLESFDAQMKLLGSAFEDVMITIGMKLLPVMKGLVDITKNVLVPAFGAAVDVVSALLHPIALVIEHVDTLKPGLVGLGIVITAALIPAFLTWAAVAVPAAAAVVLSLLPIIATVAAIAAAVVGVSAAVNFFAMDFGEMGDRIHKIADDTKNDFTEVKDWIRDRMAETGETFEEAAAAAEKHFSKIPRTADRTMGEMTAETHRHLLAAKGMIDTETEEAATAANENFEAFKAGVQRSMEDTVDAVEDGLDAMVQAFRDAEDPARQAGNAAADAWLDPVKTATEIAALEAELGSQELAENLRSQDANIRRDAEFRTMEITAELIKLKNNAATQGDEMAQNTKTRALRASQFMQDGLRSKDPEIRALFQRWDESLGARVRAMERTAAGAQISQALAGAIRRGFTELEQATVEASWKVNAVFPHSEPRDPRSGFRGITTGFGIGKVMEDGFRMSLRGVDFGDVFNVETPRLSVPSPAILGGGGDRDREVTIPIHIENFNGTDQDVDRLADRLAYRLRLAGA